MVLVRNSELLTAVSTTGSQHAATILGSHSLAETMLVHATTVVRLKCSFHLDIYLNYYIPTNNGHNGSVWAAKLLRFFQSTKKTMIFRLKKDVFPLFYSNFAPTIQNIITVNTI